MWSLLAAVPSGRWSPVLGPILALCVAVACAVATRAAWTNYADRVNARIVAEGPACAVSWRIGRRSREQGEARACDDPRLSAELEGRRGARTVRGRLLDLVFDDRDGHRRRARLFLAEDGPGERPRGDVIQVAHHPGRVPEVEAEAGFLPALAGILGWPLLGLLALAVEAARWREWMRA